MTQQTYAPVARTITVAVPQKRAFEVFTEKFGSWWPKEYSIGEAEMADFIIEPKSGGRWYEIGVDGTECETGRVTAFEPPDRLVLAWQLNAAFQFDPDLDHASELEIRFVAETPTSTRVELEHRGFDRHGAGAEAVYGAVEGPQGWDYCLDAFTKAVIG